MRLSAEKLSAEAESTGFRPDVLEKVVHLLGVLDTLQSHPFLKRKLVLKGGTALNPFVFDVPRLSVDIGLNCVGAESRHAMLEEHPKIEQAVQAVFKREGFTVRRRPEEHAGGKWSLRYQSASGQRGDLILRMDGLNLERLRIAFVVYGAMNRKDWRTVPVGDVDFDAAELASQLIPTLRLGAIQGTEGAGNYGKMLVEECRQALSAVLPFNDAEREFSVPTLR